MLLFETIVTDLNSDKEIGYTSMIGNIADLSNKESVKAIMESMGNFLVEFKRKKERNL